MTGYLHDGSAHRPVDHSWVLTAWVLPMGFAIGSTILTAGFGAISLAAAIMIGLLATVLHASGRSK